MREPEPRGSDFSPRISPPKYPSPYLNKEPEHLEPEMPEKEHPSKSISIPSKIEIPKRLYNDLQVLMKYSEKTDEEAGGFLIIGLHGRIGVVSEQLGEDREIVLEPNEKLHKHELYIGTVHSHPVTYTASTGDVISYLNDKNEKVMAVTGADSSLNFFFKTPVIKLGDFEKEIKENFEQKDMPEMAKVFGFLWYRGEENDGTTLSLQTKDIDDLSLDIIEETWPIEKLIEELGIEGIDEFPEEYSTKKNPIKKSFVQH